MDPLAAFRPDQPLTADECRFVEFLRSSDEGLKYLRALEQAGVDIEPRDGAVRLRLRTVDSAFVESIITRLLLPLAEHFTKHGGIAGAADCAMFSLRIALATLDESNGATLNSANDLASAWCKLGFGTRSQELLQFVYTACERTRGADHVDTMTIANNLAHALHEAGRYEDALKLFQRVLAFRERTLGAKDGQTWSARRKVAECLQDTGRYDDAFRMTGMLRGAIEDASERSREQVSVWLTTIRSLCALGRSQEALPAAEDLLQRCTALFGEDDRQTTSCVHALARCLELEDRLDDALLRYQQVLRAHELRYGAEHRDTVVACGNVGACLMNLKRASEALVFLTRSHAASEVAFEAGHAERHSQASNLAGCLSLLGRNDEAVALLARTRSAAEAMTGPGSEVAAFAEFSLACTLEKTDPGAAAAQWRRVAAMLTSSPQPGGNWMTACVHAARMVRGHARAGRMADWDIALSELADALVDVVDFQTAIQLSASRAEVREFFRIYLDACIVMQRPDLIPAVLAARQGRKLSALAEALAVDVAEPDIETPAGQLRVLRKELRRLALGLPTFDGMRNVAAGREDDVVTMVVGAMSAEQRAHLIEYNKRLAQYQALRDQLREAPSQGERVAARASIARDDLRASLGPHEGIAVLYDYYHVDGPWRTIMALVVSQRVISAVSLDGEAIEEAVTLSRAWTSSLQSRGGAFRGLVPDREEESQSTPTVAFDCSAAREALQEKLQIGLWKPLAEFLGNDNIHILHLVTHGNLHILPLHLGAPEMLRVLRYPGIASYTSVRKAEQFESDSATGIESMLGIAIQESRAAPGLAPIPFTVAEKWIVRGGWRGRQREDPDLHDNRPLAALHMAAHGGVDENDPARASLLLDYQRLDLQTVLRARRRALFVMLSACTVGRAQDDPDGDPVGLVGAFMLKGSRVVVASLQPVPDFYMPLFSALFYQSWSNLGHPVLALDDAKRRFALGVWHESTARRIREHYVSVLVNQLAVLAQDPPASGPDPLWIATQAWPFPALDRYLAPDSARLRDLRERLRTPEAQSRMAEAIFDCLAEDRESIPPEVVDTIDTWVVAFGG